MGTGLSWMFVRVGWRNLWRNRGRTWRTALSIAVGAMVVICGMSIQLGMYGDMIDLATRLGSGHLQVQHAEYLEDPRPKYLIPRANALARQLDALPEVPAVAEIQRRLGAQTEGQRAAAIELALEALYLAKRIDKVSGEGETVYG